MQPTAKNRISNQSSIWEPTLQNPCSAVTDSATLVSILGWVTLCPMSCATNAQALLQIRKRKARGAQIKI